MAKFFRTTVEIEIISEEPIGSPSLAEIDYQITEGNWSGQYHVISEDELSSKEAAKMLLDQGSDPGFFGLDDDGKSLKM